MDRFIKVGYFLGFAVVAIGSFFALFMRPQIPPIESSQQQTQVFTQYASTVTEQTQATIQPTQQVTVQPLLSPPLPDALSRVTKKTFGLYVSPGNSPVSPEKFQGYHTGVDFETFPDEQEVDVPVSAVCSGPLVMKKVATGYGGVAVQQCTLDGQDVTIVYGHLRFTSIKPAVHDQLQAGQTFAVLGTGYSSETDGERKHLHLGIHKGTTINILGYVQTKAALSQWLDATKYLSF